MRQDLQLSNLDEVLDECGRLHRSGYQKSGNWSLGQICRHLRLTIENNMHGYPKWMTLLGLPLRPFLRHFALPKLLNGQSPQGLPTAGMFVPPDDVDDVKELELLQQCVTEFSAHTQPLHAHPGFGGMTQDGFNQFHAAHAAHHLKFLMPEPAEQ